MRSSSSKRSGKTRKGAISRPVDPSIMRRAREIAAGYQFIIKRDEDGEYVGWSAELSGVIGGGRTAQECLQKVMEIQTFAVAVSLEAGEQPPMPGSVRRDVQVNIRMSAEEKMRIEALAERKGFRNISEYLRTTGLDGQSAA